MKFQDNPSGPAAHLSSEEVKRQGARTIPPALARHLPLHKGGYGDDECGGIPQPRSCEGCTYDLGGGRDNCLLNVAFECRDGGGYEAYKAKEKAEPKQLINKEPAMRLTEMFTDEVLKATIALDVSKAAVCQDWRADSHYMQMLDELSAEIASVTDAEYSKQMTEMLAAKKHCYGIDQQAWLMHEALAVDAEPIRHGHWIRAGSKAGVWHCSECGERITNISRATQRFASATSPRLNLKNSRGAAETCAQALRFRCVNNQNRRTYAPSKRAVHEVNKRCRSCGAKMDGGTEE